MAPFNLYMVVHARRPMLAPKPNAVVGELSIMSVKTYAVLFLQRQTVVTSLIRYKINGSSYKRLIAVIIPKHS